MKSLKQQLFLIVIGPVVILSIIMTLIVGIHLKDRALLATTTKAKSDLMTGETIIDLMYPGPWKVKDGLLYKGEVKISNNFTSVNKIAALTGDTVTIFLGDTRVATTVREKNGDRAIGTKVSDIVATTVLKHGQMYLGEANVVGEYYQTAYKPIRDSNGRIIGMFYVGISKKFSDEMIHNSMVTIGLIGLILTLVVAIGAWYFSQKVIIGPLQKITKGTLAVASGKPYNKVAIDSPNEIGDLALAFNQMVEGMQMLALKINQSTNKGVEEPGEIRAQAASSEPDVADLLPTNDELPKGLNENTMKQILVFLQGQADPLSAEEVGDGVNLTRVTARRYLEFLESIGHVTVELKYGTVGRPVKLYSCVES